MKRPEIPDYKRDIYRTKRQGRRNVEKRRRGPLACGADQLDHRRFWQHERRQHLRTRALVRQEDRKQGVVTQSARCKSAGHVQVAEHIERHAIDVDAVLRFNIHVVYVGKRIPLPRRHGGKPLVMWMRGRDSHNHPFLHLRRDSHRSPAVKVTGTRHRRRRVRRR